MLLRSLFFPFFAALLATATVGCSCSKNPAPTNPDAGDVCTAASDCASGVCTDAGVCAPSCKVVGSCEAGFYCGPTGACMQDCTPDGGGCAPGDVCNVDGMCVAPVDGGPDQTCASVEVSVAPQIPTVVLLIDRSFSMTTTLPANDNMAPQRWEATEDALVNMTDGIVKDLEDKVSFGVTFYTSYDGNSQPMSNDGMCPRLDSVAPKLMNYTDIRDEFDALVPADDTPTGESVKSVADNFPTSDGPRVIVLATDGEPDDCTNFDPPEGMAGDAIRDTIKAAVVTEVQNAYNKGIETIILNVGEGTISEEHLRQLANAGAGQNIFGGSALPFKANSKTELVDAFETIVKGVRSCDFDVDGKIDIFSQDRGEVFLDGDLLVPGTEWKLKDESTLQLLEPICTQFKEAESASIKAIFPCGAVLL